MPTRYFVFLLLLLSGECLVRSQENLRTYMDEVYASVDGRDLKIDVYTPESKEPSPVVVWLHGGGWRAGSKDRPPIRKVTQHGFALASVEYRFTDVEIFPAQIHDCKAAIRFLRGNAERYSIDSDRVAVAGSSAGGHLALLLGVSADVASLEGELGTHGDESSRVQAIVDYYGPSDFELRVRTQPDRALTNKSGSFALLGGLEHGTPIPELQSLASPAIHVSMDDPPLLIFHGDRDQVVLMDQSDRIHALYQDSGLKTELVVVPGAGHGGAEFFSGANFERMIKFLSESLD